MPAKKKANYGDLTSKLDFLGLDLENIPEFLKDFSPLNFNTSRLNNDKDHRVYRYVPIDEIEILITPSLRSDDIKKKYSEAVPLGKFFNPKGEEEDIERYATLLKIISSMSVTDIENIASLQKSLDKSEPFKVKYNKDHMWQIYYSPNTNRYFMLVCTREETFSEFLYLLKKKIEYNNKKAKTVPTIFVPINYVNYSEEFLNRDEIANVESYLWLFTKSWPLIFEVYNTKNVMSLQIVGDTYVYNGVKSSYKVKLDDKEEALKFYKLLKALFILQTEIKNKFAFETKIDSKNGLEFYYENTRVTYENLEDFIKMQYQVATTSIYEVKENLNKLEEKLADLKEKSKQKENEYLERQKEISTYLEYKKTFFGKMKYFFKSSKKSKKQNVEQKQEQKEVKEVELEPVIEQIKEKAFYTIEDLVVVYGIKDKVDKKQKDFEQDIKALELKFENLNSKVRNAELYIEEIDKHKKSIFEFWKFANKDEKLSLEMGNENSKKNENAILRKAFEFEMDFESLGVSVDKIQRVKLSKEETDSLFIANTELIEIINTLRSGNMDKQKMEASLKCLKDEFNKHRLYIDSEDFDIFGNVDNDSRKIKYIGSKSHRENEKSKFRILNVNKKIDVFDFTEKLLSIISYLDGAMPKMSSKYDMPLYKVVPITDNIHEGDFSVFDINVERELENYQDSGEGAVNLIKLNFKEDMPLLYYSNIIFFDNTNQTLPEGMDLSSNVLVDCKKFNFTKVSQTKFRTNKYFNEQNNLILPKSKDILVYEYDVTLKTDNKENVVEEVRPKIEKEEENYIEKEDLSEEFNMKSLEENISELDDLEDEPIVKEKSKKTAKKKTEKKEKVKPEKAKKEKVKKDKVKKVKIKEEKVDEDIVEENIVQENNEEEIVEDEPIKEEVKPPVKKKRTLRIKIEED
jgi:hypothetical protein